MNETHLVDAQRCQARSGAAVPFASLCAAPQVEARPLHRPPARDPDFNTADLPMMVRVGELPARFRRHFDAAR